MKGWIGIDLDGTLAYYDGWRGADHIGEPIPAMLELVKAALRDGYDVRIFTARVSCPAYPISPVASRPLNREGRLALQRIQDAETARRAINAWCEKHFGQRLPITNVKDWQMVELWDDKAIGVVTNTGERVG